MVILGIDFGGRSDKFAGGLEKGKGNQEDS